jgi:F-type H+-transporting ATPase subunit b
MEQIIDVFGLDWKILIVQIVNFALLLGILWYFLYKPLTTLIENRRAQIIKGVADAERAEAALKDADAKKGEIMTAASMDAERVIATAREQAKQKESQIMVEAQEKYERVLREAALKSEEIRKEALDESKEEIAKLIVLGAEKALREKSA